MITFKVFRCFGFCIILQIFWEDLVLCSVLCLWSLCLLACVVHFDCYYSFYGYRTRHWPFSSLKGIILRTVFSYYDHWGYELPRVCFPECMCKIYVGYVSDSIIYLLGMRAGASSTLENKLTCVPKWLFQFPLVSTGCKNLLLHIPINTW